MPITRPIPTVFTDEQDNAMLDKNYHLWNHRRDTLIRLTRQYHELYDDMQDLYNEETERPFSQKVCGCLAATGHALLEEIASLDEYYEQAQQQCKLYTAERGRRAGFRRHFETGGKL